MSKEVAVPETPVDPSVAEWNNAANDAVVIVSYDVAKDEYLDALVGIDLIVTGVTYREGIPDPATKTPRAYVSLECLLSPSWDIRRINLARAASDLHKIESLDEIPWEPGEHVVINSGSTGIYRQITEVLFEIGAIKLPDPVVRTGKRGECSFDLPPGKWTDCLTGASYFNDNGFLQYVNTDLRLRCKKGVRVSSYQTDDYGDATTYYLA